jgi:hypothetical protein
VVEGQLDELDEHGPVQHKEHPRGPAGGPHARLVFASVRSSHEPLRGFTPMSVRAGVLASYGPT